MIWRHYEHGPNEWQVLPSISKFVEFYRLVLRTNMQLHSSKIKYGNIFHSFDNLYVFYASSAAHHIFHTRERYSWSLI